jgi:hypothetical protein
MSDSALGDSCAEADSEQVNIKYKSNVYWQPNIGYKAKDQMDSLDEKNRGKKMSCKCTFKVWLFCRCEDYTGCEGVDTSC